ncbi:hypothetical protein [Novosphingobium album (ex Liu et al. 2023)]|uniref:Uncharacterized protein n=1 Tax=Novosphingobium album (ex Liu et al. 2023) TaxID=3031130 RepID=A0ABT5WNZ8_9SPHN|nr:hypothetical protein [Novosphingobium album (ex Liu et al. 2023)]MDE8650653.1 hypothetical protein [Novosphingobium album (ex Liu et al. 2023)]
MLQTRLIADPDSRPFDMPRLVELLSQNSSRPRYAYMVLDLIAKIANPDGSAGPLVVHDGKAISIRDWLCDALVPMANSYPRRMALAARVREEMKRAGGLPADPAQADQDIESEIRARIRASGKTNVSRAVSDLVRAGILHRHYQGYRVDHHNRGAQRQAVYTLSPTARKLLLTDRARSAPPQTPRQGSLAFG